MRSTEGSAAPDMRPEGPPCFRFCARRARGDRLGKAHENSCLFPAGAGRMRVSQRLTVCRPAPAPGAALRRASFFSSPLAPENQRACTPERSGAEPCCEPPCGPKAPAGVGFYDGRRERSERWDQADRAKRRTRPSHLADASRSLPRGRQAWRGPVLCTPGAARLRQAGRFPSTKCVHVCSSAALGNYWVSSTVAVTALVTVVASSRAKRATTLLYSARATLLALTAAMAAPSLL